jgi:hypothetical protein
VIELVPPKLELPFTVDTVSCTELVRFATPDFDTLH